jgi:transmembrane sensor
MTSTEGKVRELIAEEAAAWFVANREGLASKDREAFVAWLQTSPVHVEEYLAHTVIARDLRAACDYSADALEELLVRARTQPDPIASSSWAHTTRELERPRAPWRRHAAAIAAACVVGGIGWVALGTLRPIKTAEGPGAITEINLATRHGELLSRRLADSTVLHLNTDSAVTIRYSNQERLVFLHNGEADFAVTHEAGRAFRVVAGAVQVVDRGTQFDVLRERGATVVTVVEGQVAVSSSLSDGRGAVTVGGNHQVTVVEGVWPPAKAIAVDAQKTTAWLHRQIVFNHAPLDKVAAEFNRYAPKPIEIVTPGLQKLEISGVFSTDDPAAFIAFLRSLNSVRVEETATQIRVSGNPN